MEAGNRGDSLREGEEEGVNRELVCTSAKPVDTDMSAVKAN